MFKLTRLFERGFYEKGNRNHASWREKNPTYMRFYMRDYRDRKKKLPKVHDDES